MNIIGGLQTCNFNMPSIQIVYKYSRLNNVSIELCNLFLSVNVTLDMNCYVLHSFKSLYKAVCADHLLGQCLL